MICKGPTRGSGQIRGRLPPIGTVRRVRETTASGLSMRVNDPQDQVRVRDPRVRRASGRTGRVTRTPGLGVRSLINGEQPEVHQHRRVADLVAPQTVGDAAGQVTVKMVTVIAVMTQSRMAEIRNTSRR